MAITTRACAICGKDFASKGKHHIVCSRECKDENTRRIKREWSRRNYAQLRAQWTLPPKKCTQCGAQYTPRRESSLTCSTKCSVERATRRANERRIARMARHKSPKSPVERTCTVCGKKYRAAAKSKHSIICGGRCKVLRGNAMKAAVRRNIPAGPQRERFIADFIASDGQRRDSHQWLVELRKKKAEQRALEPKPTPEPKAKPVWSAPAVLCCRGCGRSVPRESAVLDCCGMECAEAVMQRIGVKALSDELDVGTPVLVRRARVMSIDGRERLIDTSDAGRITAIFGGVANIESEGRTLSAPEADIERTVGAVQRLKEKMAMEREETWVKRAVRMNHARMDGGNVA